MMGVMPTRWWPRPTHLLRCVVAVLGIGGLGHLGVQFANKLGFCTVAIARGSDKEALSRNLGAHHFIDSATEDVAARLNRLGGARAVLATVTSA